MKYICVCIHIYFRKSDRITDLNPYVKNLPTYWLILSHAQTEFKIQNFKANFELCPERQSLSPR